MSLTHIIVDFDNVKPSAADIALAHGKNLRLAIVRGPQPTRYEADLAETLHALGDQVSFSRCVKAGKNAADMQIAFHVGELVATLPAGTHKVTRFIVISRDRGFEPLMMYLRSKGFNATLAANFKAALGGEASEDVKPARKRAAKAAPAAKGDGAKAPTAKSAAAKPVAKKSPGRKSSAQKTAKAPTERKSGHVVDRASSKAEAPDAAAKVIDSLQRMRDKRPAKRKGLERHIESHLGRKLATGQVEALIDQLTRDGVLAFDGNKVDYRLPKAKR
ncbi:MAG TPA: PIN domain-containing protein [Burkholderiaceae bacterium]|nr:PIN domain-containing protein [Burkholderiaceae bacterium]